MNLTLSYKKSAMLFFTLFILLTTTNFCLAFRPGEPPEFSKKLSEAALERTTHKVRYDGKYLSIPYPGGDVPDNIGVCTDVVIRSYRKLGVDLQKDLHEDMKAAFSKYPKKWGLKKTDSNIDHRRVPNLRRFFERKGTTLRVSKNPADYRAGDLVTWMLSGNLPHIGIVVNKKSRHKRRNLIVHNIGSGTQLEDMLFDYKITGHYRYYGSLGARGDND